MLKKTKLSVLITLIGFSLIFLNLCGLFIKPTSSMSSVKLNKIPGYDFATKNPSELLNLLENPNRYFDLEKTNELIYQTIKHSDNRKMKVYENWIFWGVGFFLDDFQRTRVPRRFIMGQEALCGEVSILLNSIAESHNHQSRLILLGGHVVSEIQTKDGWRVADPDYGITYSTDLAGLEEPKGMLLMKEELAQNGYSGKTIDNYIKIFQSTKNNIYSETSTALSPRLYRIEIISDYLKWLFPIALLFYFFLKDKTILKKGS